jgi:hypothetical protein
LSPIFHHHRIDWSGHTNTLPPPCRTRHLSPKCFAEARTKIPANSNQAVMNRTMLKYQQAMQTECKFRRRQESNDTTHITSRVLYDTFGLYWRDSCTGMWAFDYKKETLHQVETLTGEETRRNLPMNNQLDTQFLLYMFIYFDSLHVSSM